MTQGGEHLAVSFNAVRPFGMTVLVAVGVPELRLRCAAGDEIFELVQTALGAWYEVVQVEKRRMLAAWNLATLVVAPEHGAT
jgi:hypothetical protein